MRNFIYCFLFILASCEEDSKLNFCINFNQSDVRNNDIIILNELIKCNFDESDTVCLIGEIGVDASFIIFNKNHRNFAFIFNLNQLKANILSIEEIKIIENINLNTFKKAIENYSTTEDDFNNISNKTYFSLMYWTHSKFIYNKSKRTQYFTDSELKISGLNDFQIFYNYNLVCYKN